MNDETTVHDSTGNVFADMGMRDAEKRLAKAELARSVRRILDQRALKDAEAADLLDITRPDMLDLMRGKLARFSRERLESYLTAASPV